MSLQFSSAALCALWLACSLCVAHGVRAGGSAETTLVVVNAHSPLSQRIANEYLKLREIPETHVLRLSGVPSLDTMSIKDFRGKIWGPIQEFLREHSLEEEIDLIAYSGDFPYGVNFGPDVKAKRLPGNRYRGGVGALTGLTYFGRRVEQGDPGYLGVNHYFREFAGPRPHGGRRAAGTATLGEKEVKRLRKEAGSAMKRKEYAAAAGAYRALRDAYPEEAEFWYELARAQAASGDPAQALQTLGEAVERGWTQSLRTRRDRELEALHSDPVFQALVERMENAYGPFEVAHGFRHDYVWSNSDLAMWEPDDVLDQYYLSTMLAYTGVHGNSLPEILAYLTRAAASDGTAPDGTVYLMENNNVRSETRQPLFPATVQQLARRGRRAEILSRDQPGQNGIIPVNRDDVIGLVVGSAGFDWQKSNSQLLPGAIAESLTSYGGHFNLRKQTKLTAFLRHGAAGSSGAVMEPYSFQEKFPVPLLHAYYADGCSLAEAFYQSILAPYQLIIVGDPLARPFARFAEVGLAAPAVSTPWSGTVAIQPMVHPVRGKAIRAVELWVDGQYLAQAPLGEPIAWDTRTAEDGSHEVRLVAVEDSVIETRSSYRAQVRVFNHAPRIEIERFTADVDYAQHVEFAGSAPGAERVELRRGYDLLDAAELSDGRWRLAVPAQRLGIGSATVQVRAQYPGGHAVRADPLTVKIREPRLIPALTSEKPLNEGLVMTIFGPEGEPQELRVERLIGALRPRAKGGVKAERVRLTGRLRVEQPGFHQLVVRSDGRLKIWLQNQAVLDAELSLRDPETFVPVGLEAGWHALEIELAPGGREPFLKLVLAGASQPVGLSKRNLGHP